MPRRADCTCRHIAGLAEDAMINTTVRPKVMQQWERAEIARSSVEATLTPDSTLRVSPATFGRYAAPPANTAYPLEYSYHLLGDVTGHRVVDFGCGSGSNTALLAGRRAHVWAIDISEDLLRLGQRRLTVSGREGGATFIAGSAHDLPFPDDSIDVVFGIAILHHLDLDLVRREVYRVLKPGGRAIFQEPVRNSAVIRFMRSLTPYHAPDISPYERPLTDAEVDRFASGFSRCAIRAFALPHVQLGMILPVVKRFWRTLYAADRVLLKAAPWLTRYASVRVISVVK
jgi:SAM-dependent methyltransferase